MKKAALIAAIAAIACAPAGCGGGDGGGGGDRAGGDAAGAVTTPQKPEPTPTTSPKPKPTPKRKPKRKARPDAVAVGIGEQGAAMFADKRFLALRIDKARLVVPYDAIARRTERELTDAWLDAAQRAGVEPFITFGHSRAHPARLPSVAEFRSAFRAFRTRYPNVHIYAPWNEINHVSQPTAGSPQRAAEYYNVVKAGCAGCTVLAGDVLDQAGMITYLRRYRRHLAGTPAVWGLHNYGDTNRFRTRGLHDLLRTVTGDVWLTETGGIVKLGRNLPRDEQRAARSVTYALKLARNTARVKRVYLYNWTGAQPGYRFDSGLVGPGGGAARPGYEALRRGLGR